MHNIDVISVIYAIFRERWRIDFPDKVGERGKGIVVFE